MPKILIIEDEPDLILGLQINCRYEGYKVFVARDGKEGIEQALKVKPDIILLDIMLPGVSGLDVCRQLRSQGMDTPIIMLTARGQEIDKVVGLEMGADDYVTKPFSVKELFARIRAQLRRATKQVVKIDTYEYGNIMLDFKKYQANKGGKEIELSPKEFELMRYFIQHIDEIVTRDELLDNVWGYESYPITRTVDNHIAKLRQKLEDVPSEPVHIVTVHRVGYKFIA